MGEFKEIQSFNLLWLWVIGLTPVLIIISVFVIEITNGNAKSTVDYLGIAVTVLIATLTFLWLKVLRLETQIDANGISVNFIGLVFAKRIIKWNEVESTEIVKYNPLWDYGGWGVKFGFSKGWCYNVSGDIGLHVKLKSGKPLMIGTQKQDELRSFLNSVSHFSNIGISIKSAVSK